MRKGGAKATVIILHNFARPTLCLPSEVIKSSSYRRMRLRPCLAASFLAAAFVLPRPFPQRSPLTKSFTAQSGVLFSKVVSSNFHSTRLLYCCMHKLNWLRWLGVAELVVTARDLGGDLGGVYAAREAPGPLLEPTGLPCRSRTMRYASCT